MDRTLKRGPNGHYSTDQWVTATQFTNQDPEEMGYRIGYLDDKHGIKHGGFVDADTARIAMHESRWKMCDTIVQDIHTAIKKMEPFSVRGISVEFNKGESSGRIMSVTVSNPCVQYQIPGEFAANWEEGDLRDMIMDALLLCALSDRNGAPEPQPEYAEPPPRDLLWDAIRPLAVEDQEGQPDADAKTWDAVDALIALVISGTNLAPKLADEDAVVLKLVALFESRNFAGQVKQHA